MKEQIDIEYNETTGYDVEFYGILKDKERKHLFSVCFNSDEGELLGYFDRTNGVVNVSLKKIDVEFDLDWSQEERDQIYAMQEEMNYVIEMLSYEEDYIIP